MPPLVGLVLLTLSAGSGCNLVTADHLENVPRPWALYNAFSDPVPPPECRWITDAEHHGYQANRWRPWSETWQSPIPAYATEIPFEPIPAEPTRNEVPTEAESFGGVELPAIPKEPAVTPLPETLPKPTPQPLPKSTPKRMPESVLEPLPESPAEPELDEPELDDTTNNQPVHRMPFPPLRSGKTSLKTPVSLTETLPLGQAIPLRAIPRKSVRRASMLEFANAKGWLRL